MSIEAYLQPEDKFISCIFAELANGKLIQKGVYAKMARGEMVLFWRKTKLPSRKQCGNFAVLDINLGKICQRIQNMFL